MCLPASVVHNQQKERRHNGLRSVVPKGVSRLADSRENGGQCSTPPEKTGRGSGLPSDYFPPATSMGRLLRHQIGARWPIWMVNSLPLPSTVVGPLLKA